MINGMIDFKLFRGFGDAQTDGRTHGRTDIDGCRVTFVTENLKVAISDHKMNSSTSELSISSSLLISIIM